MTETHHNTPHPHPPDPTFAQVLTKALQNQSLTLERIVAHLRASGNPVSTATLSYWKNGRSVPTRAKSLKVLAELEHLLKVEPGTLSSALPEGLKWDPRAVMPEATSVDELLADIGLSLARSWSRISLRDRMVVQADRSEGRQYTHMVVRAETHNAQFWPVVLHADSDSSHATPEVHAGWGCELTDVRALPDKNITVASLQLPEPVPRGTLVSVEYSIDWNGAEEAYRVERSLPNTAKLLVLEVQFEGDTPQSFNRYQRATYGTSQDQPLEILQPQGRWVQTVIQDPPPGIHGIGWNW